MKVCIRCNPITELVETDEGLRCVFHEKQFLAEERFAEYVEPVHVQEVTHD